MRSRRGTRTLAVATVVVLATTGGSCQPADDSAPPVPDISYTELPAGPDGPVDEYNRRVPAPVPARSVAKAVEFSSADTGYALFERCEHGKPCAVGLVVTLDGGFSWLARKLPFSEPTAVQLRLGRGDVLMIRAEPHGWFISRDTGRTFIQRPLDPAPVELNLTGSPFQLGCADGGDRCSPKQVLRVGDDGVRTPVPVQPPPAEYTGLAIGADGRLWLVAETHDKRANPPVRTVTVLTGANGGTSWAPAGSVQRSTVGSATKVAVSPDGAHVWLFADRFAARRDGAGAWTESAPAREFDRVTSAEVMSGGRLLVATGTSGVWNVDGDDRIRESRARSVFSLRRVDDQLMQGYVTSNAAEVWLCRQGEPRPSWFRVEVIAPQS